MSEPRTPLPAGKGAADLASVMAALEKSCAGSDGPAGRRLVRARRRGALTLLMMVLLVAGVIELFTLTPDVRPVADGGSRASVVFSNARSGTCLSWPPDAPDKPSFVQCRSDHMFEVAKPVQISDSQEPCQLAVREYLGTRYDPSSRFTVNVLVADDDDGAGPARPNLLCGLQLTGANGKPMPFKGRIVDLDQSRVWPAGTCLGIDSAKRSTDLPVDCATPHGLEVAGAVSLAERFPGGLPSDADQRAFVGEACTKAADAYLAPAALGQTGLTLSYETLSSASWSAGSRQVSCGVGRPAEQGWAAVTGSARTASPADLPPPPAPPPPPPVEAAPPPPPVYEEPLIPVPTELPARPAPETAAPPAAPSTTTTVAPSPSPATGPAPGPATTPSETSMPSETSTEPPPGVIQLPGLPAITLPGYVPPEPAPPQS